MTYNSPEQSEGDTNLHAVERVGSVARSAEESTPVTHCICHSLSFAELKRRADAESLSFDELKARTGCATGCGTCTPYIQLMLVTGETRFPVLSGAMVASLIKEHLARRGKLSVAGRAGTNPSDSTQTT